MTPRYGLAVLASWLAVAACQPAPSAIVVSEAARGIAPGAVAPTASAKPDPGAVPQPPGASASGRSAAPVAKAGGSPAPELRPRAGVTPRPWSPSAVATQPTNSATPVAGGQAARPAPAASLPAPGTPLHTGAWLVRFAAGAEPTTALAALAGFRERGRLTLAGRLLLRLEPPAGLDAAAARARLVAAPGVEQVLPEARRHRQAFTFTQPDPFLGLLWAHRTDRGNTVNAWSLVPPAAQAKIVLAVLDTGLDVNHPDFAGRIVDPQNFSPDGLPGEVVDVDGHGTHVAGTAAATGDDGVGVAGVAWGVRIKPVKVLGDDGGGNDFDILAGFLHAVRWRPSPDDGTRVRVINMSLGSATGSVSALWIDAAAEAREAGIVVLAAAGNDGLENVDSPANTPGILAVGSTNDYLLWEDLSPFSNHGDRLDLVAPGEDIFSTAPLDGSTLGASFAYSSGTSMATPYAAGVACLLVARYDPNNANATAAFVDAADARLKAAVTDLGVPGRDPWFGTGRLDAARAVTPTTLDAAP